MYNQTKIKAIILLAILGAFLFVGMIGYTLGNQLTLHKANQEAEKVATLALKEKDQEKKGKTLSQEKVKAFLIQYYTKKKLGENNSRIQLFMTEAAYNEELAKQESAVHQVNKDFVVDYIFEEATVFINSQTKEAIAEVVYSVTYLSDVRNGQQFKNIQKETQTIKLGYTEASSKLLVNHIQPWKIALSNMADGGETLLNQQIPASDAATSPKPSNEISSSTTQ